MTRLHGMVLAALVGLASTPAMAQRAVVPIVNLDNLPVTTVSGVTPTAAQVRQSIEAAALSRDWEIREAAPGQLVASLSVRGKHTITTDIAYSATTYSIRYRDSVNMKFKAADPASAPVVGLIHPFYNRWVDDLDRAIRVSFAKLS